MGIKTFLCANNASFSQRNIKRIEAHCSKDHLNLLLFKFIEEQNISEEIRQIFEIRLRDRVHILEVDKLSEDHAKGLLNTQSSKKRIRILNTRRPEEFTRKILVPEQYPAINRE